MWRNRVFPLLVTSMFGICSMAYCQDALLQMLEDSETPKQEKVTNTFSSTRVIQAHSIQTLHRKNLDVRISHRFGNIYSTRNSIDGPDSFFGFDNIADVRLAVEYGITDNVMIGIGRSQMHKLIDGLVKYRFYEQTTDNKRPISLTFFANITVSPEKRAAFYAGVNDSLIQTFGASQKFFHRLSYTAQLIIARKFSPSISMELLPTYVHRNFVRDPKDENSIFALGVAGRFKVSKRVAILADYFYVFSPYRYNQRGVPFYMPISVGVEIQTGGHIFQIDISNARGIISNNFLVESPESWQYAEIKLGFNISRVFNVGKRMQKAKEVIQG